MSIHIFLVVSDMGLGGIQKKIVDLAKTDLKRSDSTNVVFHCIYRDDKTFFSLPNNKHFKFHRVPKLKILRRYQEGFFNAYILFLFWRYRPRTVVFFLHHLASRIINLKKKFLFLPPTKYIISQDTILSKYNQSKHTDIVFSRKEILELYNQAESVLVQTHAAKTDLEKNFSINSSQIKVIPNWLPKLEESTHLSFPNSDLLYYGRLEPQKRIDVMVALFNNILKLRPSTKLTIVGNGTQKEKILRLIHKHGLQKNLSLLPPTTQVRSLLRKSKIFLSTSEFEGYPLTLIEAMSEGVVPVILPFPGASEYLLSGKTGFIESNTELFVKRVVSLLDHPNTHKKISIQARLFAKNNFGERVKKEFIDTLIT